jgi:hypothetical protein
MAGIHEYAREIPGVPEEILLTTTGDSGGEYTCYTSKIAQPPLLCYDYGYLNTVGTIDLYLLGFPLGQQVELELYDPAGFLAGMAQVSIDTRTQSYAIEPTSQGLVGIRNLELDPTPTRPGGITVENASLQHMTLWVPVGMPEGDWLVVATGGAQSAEMTITLRPNDGPRISLLPDLIIDPFSPQSCATYPTGSTIYIAGTGFDAYQMLPLGI